MTQSRVIKTFKIESEPVLRWPTGPAELYSAKGVRLEHSGRGMAYDCFLEKGSCVHLIGWNYEKGFANRRNVFSEPRLEPTGLISLAKLDKNFTGQTVREWATRNGPLGFHARSYPQDYPSTTSFIPPDDITVPHYEPVKCIRDTAQRAANVVLLWDAWKKSFATGHGSTGVQAIQSVVTVRQDIKDSIRIGYSDGSDKESTNPIQYRVSVNGEKRSRWPVPQSSLDWRILANALLAEYIQEHIEGNVRVVVGLRRQNKDVQDGSEDSPDYNLTPIWRISSALTAYYVELLMVMRRFRVCPCGEDISHQKPTSVYCGNSCRSTYFYRRKAEKKRSL